MKHFFNKINSWDKAALIIILILIAVLLWEPLLTTAYFHDFTYHLRVAQNFERAGGVVTWDFWESLPSGRPHNYPPLFHLFLLLLLKFNWEIFTLIRIASFLTVVIMIFLSWWGVKLLGGSRAAFIFLVLISSATTYLMFSSIVMPASLVLAASPLLFFLVMKKRILGAAALLTLMLYTQMIFPWLIIAALMIFTFKTKNLKTGLLVIALAVILYSPWLYHIIENQQYIKYLNKEYFPYSNNITVKINLSLLILFLISIFYLIWRWRPKPLLIFGFCLLIVQLPLIFSNFPARFFSSGGFLAMSIISAGALDIFLKKYNHRSILIITIILIIATHLYYFEIYLKHSEYSIMSQPVKSLINQAIDFKRSDESSWIQIRQGTYHRIYLRLAEKIKQNSEPDEVIYAATNSLNIVSYADQYRYGIAQLFGALSNRASAHPRMPEYSWQEPLALEKSAIVIADYQKTNLVSTFKDEPTQKIADQLEKDFTLIHQENRLVVFRNNHQDTFRIEPVKPIINQYRAFILIAIFLAIIIFEIKKSQINNYPSLSEKSNQVD